MGVGMQWHQLDHMQTVCTLLQTDNDTDTNAPSLNLYRPDALPDAQPTVSKHRRHYMSRYIHLLPVACFTVSCNCDALV